MPPKKPKSKKKAQKKEDVELTEEQLGDVAGGLVRTVVGDAVTAPTITPTVPTVTTEPEPYKSKGGLEAAGDPFAGIHPDI